MYTRRTFEENRAALRRGERRYGAALVIFSVGVGFAQLHFVHWADRHLDKQREIAIALPVFLVYIVVVGVLIWLLDRVRRRARPMCPGCGAAMDDLSQRIAVASGCCDRCGCQVLERPGS